MFSKVAVSFYIPMNKEWEFMDLFLRGIFKSSELLEFALVQSMSLVPVRLD